MGALAIGLIFVLLIGSCVLFFTDSHHYLLQPANWQLYKLKLKFKGVPYMLGVNTRVYGAVVFKFWGWLLLFAKLLTDLNNVAFYKLSIFNPILIAAIHAIKRIISPLLFFYSDFVILRMVYIEDRVFFWLESLDIFVIWFSWFSHFPFFSIKEIPLFENNYKHQVLFMVFYPYLILRSIYFCLIVSCLIVSASYRRRIKLA